MKNPSMAAQPSDAQASRAQSAGTHRLSILLVNHNGMRYLESCLESIHRFAPGETEVILVDNASMDGSLEAAEKNFPWLRIVRSERNLGFAGGNNLAASNAGGSFLLLLNTDTLLLEPIAPVVDWLENHRSCGAVTINMLDGERKPSACTGRFPTPLRLASFGSMLISPGQFGGQESYPVDWVQGSFLLVRADLWRSLSGLDERYFMYGEDVDLCRRIHDAGLCCAYLPGWQYVHFGGSAPSRFPAQACGFAAYAERHMAAPRRLLCIFVLYAGCLLRAAFYLARGMAPGRAIDRARAAASWHAIEALMHRAG
jgi:GT2 family glycosyltransferase